MKGKEFLNLLKRRTKHCYYFNRAYRDMFGGPSVKDAVRMAFHDFDKVLLSLLVNNYTIVKKVHNSQANHHKMKNLTDQDIREKLADWESTRYSKNDEPLNAKDFFEVVRNDYSEEDQRRIEAILSNSKLYNNNE